MNICIIMYTFYIKVKLCSYLEHSDSEVINICNIINYNINEYINDPSISVRTDILVISYRILYRLIRRTFVVRAQSIDYI